MPKVIKRQRASYSIEQKKEVVTYARQRGRNEAARHFDLDKSMVGRWVKASESWTSEIKNNTMRVGSGRKAYFPEAEAKLYNWVIVQRKKALAVTFVTVRLQMFEILREPDMVALYGELANNFMATFRWLTAFMKRHNLALRRRTRISQKLPEQLEESLESFYRFVIRLRIKNSIEMCNIFNMDETPVWFDMAGNFTINQKGEKTVHIRGTGNENNRFTVVLTCAADGTKLPPICIFKGKQMPRGEKAPPGVIVWFQESGWMNADLMKHYVSYLNQIRMSSGQSRLPAMMVYDSFRGHLEESVKQKFKENHVELAVIPGGLTSICQPLDVAINKPFKDNLRREWYHWMNNGGAGYTPAGNLRRAKISEKCGISNALDGTEDDEIYKEIDEVLDEIQNEMDNDVEEEMEIIDLNDS
ncbi:hypothetical protein RclHR1_12730011 [Rhizophagus clarus]|uniref:HTH CENPB-type domain-containing protein n=1 Tax=Rhizophagus clarus TaxID=94130 RepID=A0A2Z6QN11_9GLOM|nr:hypothetical protein RclHR1_12730011 [Rhizophagus clarus]